MTQAVVLAESGVQGSAKAWVRFNGSGGATINASYNVSSVTRVSTGIYYITFTNAFADANYSFVGNIGQAVTSGNGYTGVLYLGTASTTTAYIFAINSSSGANVDSTYITTVFNR